MKIEDILGSKEVEKLNDMSDELVREMHACLKRSLSKKGEGQHYAMLQVLSATFAIGALGRLMIESAPNEHQAAIVTNVLMTALKTDGILFGRVS